jgi:hypothetical protein
MDKISATLQAAVGGIQVSANRLHRAAHEVATASGRREGPGAQVESLVRALEAQRTLEASARIVERADEMLGSLLDTFV